MQVIIFYLLLVVVVVVIVIGQYWCIFFSLRRQYCLPYRIEIEMKLKNEHLQNLKKKKVFLLDVVLYGSKQSE